MPIPVIDPTPSRLHATIVAVCPILGVSIVDLAGHVAVIQFDPVATPAQQSAANAALAAFDWSPTGQAAFDLSQARAQTSGYTTTTIQSAPLAALVRSVVLLALDEFNAHTAKTNAILDAVDAATSLADLKARIGLIADLPVRTKAQLLAAMTTKINAGDTDS